MLFHESPTSMKQLSYIVMQANTTRGEEEGGERTDGRSVCMGLHTAMGPTAVCACLYTHLMYAAARLLASFAM